MTTRTRGVVIHAHVSTYPDPIEFDVGEHLTLGEEDDEYPGWIWVTSDVGKQGWAPVQYVEQLGDKVGEGLRRYTARELNTEVGQIVSVHDELNQWLWVETDQGEFGWVPATTVQVDQ